MNTARLARLLPLAALGTLALGLGVWLTVRPDPPVSHPERPETVVAPAAPDVLSAEERAPLDALTTPVRLLADLHGKDVGRLLEVIARLPHRPLPGDAPGAPHTPSLLAQRLSEAPSATHPLPPTASFERAALLGALGRALGKSPVYALVPHTRFAATELLARTFAVRLDPDGPWHVLPALPPLAPLARPGSDPELRPLTPAGLLAVTVAFRAMGAAHARAYPQALRLALAAVTLRPDDPALIFLQGRLEHATGSPDLARATFDRATRLARDPMTEYLLGRLARLDARPAEAQRLFMEAARDPAFAEPHVELAELTLERLDLTPRAERSALLTEARAAAARARAIAPNVRGLRLAEAHLAALGPGDDSPVDPARHKAAIDLLTEETHLHPDSEEAWLLLAQVHAAAEEDADAISVLARAHASGHETAETANALGQLLAATGRFPEAATAFERALARDPELIEVRPQLAQIRRDAGDLEGARRLLEEQLTRAPDDHVSALLLAQLAIGRGDLAAARRHVGAVLSVAPDHREGLLLRYLLELLAAPSATGQAPGTPGTPAASEAREAAIRAAGGPRQLAEVLLEQGFAREALPLLQDALTLTPDDLLAPVMLVGLLTADNRLREAADLRAATLKPLAPADRAELEGLFDIAIAEALKARPAGGGSPPPLAPAAVSAPPPARVQP